MFLRTFLFIIISFISLNCFAQSNSHDLFIKGKNAFNSGNYTEAYSFFLEAAKLNNAEAQCYIGICYDQGLGINYDKDLAFEWYQNAAGR